MAIGRGHGKVRERLGTVVGALCKLIELFALIECVYLKNEG